MARYKFDDCVSCKFRFRKNVCADCDYGEFYEDQDVPELVFDDENAFMNSADITTDDDEPIDPNDVIDKLDEQEEDEDNDQDPEDE